MTTYYADFDLGTGDNDGTSWANAWQTFAAAAAGTNGTAPTAGDTVLCRGTDTLSSGVSLTSTNTGTTSARCKFIGVNSSGVNDGTKAVLDANSGTFHILTLNELQYGWLENFEIKGTTGSYHGITYIGINNWYNVFINVYIHDCYDGLYSNSYIKYVTLFRCRFSNNRNRGVFNLNSSSFLFCRADNNTAIGFNGYTCNFDSCIADNNGDDGFYVYIGNIKSCVAYNNTGKGVHLVHGDYQNCDGVRSISNGVGIKIYRAIQPIFLYYGQGNTAAVDGSYEEVTINGTGTITTAGSDTNGGLVDPSNNDFNLRTDATYRRVAVTIP